MILSGKEILKNIESKDIIIEPIDKSRVNPNSYNLTLSDELLLSDIPTRKYIKEYPYTWKNHKHQKP